MKYSLVCILILLLSGCNDTEIKKEEISDVYATNIDDEKLKTAYLDRENNEYMLIDGTPTYDSIKLHYPELPHQFIHRSSWLNDRIGKKDSIFFTLKKDTLEISRCFFSSGSCLYFYPFYVIRGDTVHVYNPEVEVQAEVRVYQKDTFSSFVDCSLVAAGEFIIKIPITKSIEHKTIKYDTNLFQLKFSRFSKN